ncbi:hypothetical protein ETP43_13855 [Blautia faecicola]|uniref:Uncharacterized protein n=1 Tax=Blautia faecicola TaxID=2509240 RepID=A0A4Q1RK91_9FIRM|nr:hypothetical protein ETP43_13855 [Blautia faecicola]
MKNHSCNLHAPLCGIFYLHSVDVARYAALIQAKSPTNCDAHLAESLFQTRSRTFCLYLYLFQWNILSADKNIFADRRISQTVVLSCAEFKTFVAKLRGASEIIL